MGLYETPRPRQRLPLLPEIFTFGVCRRSIYIIRGGKKLPVGLVHHWADVEAMERVSGTAGLGELINGNVNLIIHEVWRWSNERSHMLQVEGP